jgi:hypothetical protein
LVAVVWLLILSLAATDTVWLPPERIEVAGGRAEVGYVLKVDEDHLVLLEERSRTVERIALDSVEKRSYCRLGASKQWWERPLQALRDSATPTYERCRDRP